MRIKSGVTQEELAEASGISVRAISDLERGRTRRPQRKTVELLASGMRLDEQDTARLIHVARKSTLQVSLPHSRAVPVLDDPGADDPGPARAEPLVAGRICELPPRLLGLCNTLPDQPVLDEFLRSVASTETFTPKNGNTALILGHPWVGKTTAAVQAAYKWRHLFPDGQVFIDLGSDGRGAMPPIDVVRRLARSVGAPMTDPADLESATASLRSFLAHRRILVVLDKVVDENQVFAVRPGAGASAVIAVCQRRLPHQPGMPTVVVEPLPVDVSVSLLAAMLGEQRVQDEYDAAIGLATVCGGIPLAMHWACGKLSANPHWTLHRMFTALIDPRTRQDLVGACQGGSGNRFHAMFEGLSPETRGALFALSHIHADEFTLDMAAAVLGTSVRATEQMISDLIEWQVLSVLCDSARFVAFRINPLVRALAVSMAETNDQLADITFVRPGASAALPETTASYIPSSYDQCTTALAE